MIVDYVINGNSATVHKWSRDEQGSRVHETDSTQEAYFFISENETTDPFRFPEVKRVDTEHDWKTIHGDPLNKVVVQNPKQVGGYNGIRDNFSDTWESDVYFRTRYWLDQLEPEDAMRNYRILSFDIEVDHSLDAANAPEPITAITAHDNFRDKYITFLLEPEGKAVEGFKKENWTLRTFNDEREMLLDFLDFVKMLDPDVITAWNLDGYDGPYVVNRMRNLRIDYSELSPINRVEMSNDRERIHTVRGREFIDLIPAFKKVYFNDLDSYRLNDVGASLLGKEKVKFETSLSQLWRDNPEKFIEYNKRDVEIMVDLDEQFRIWDLLIEVQHQVGINLSDILHNTRITQAYFMRNTDRIMPRSQWSEDGGSYQGATVLDSTPGISENVAVEDLKSQYPSSMISYNMSPEKKVESPEATDAPTVTVGNGVTFEYDELGFVPRILIGLINWRDAVKAERDQHKPGSFDYIRLNLLQVALKVIANSIYGSLGHEKFVLYDRDIARSTTYVGRETIQWAVDRAHDMGYQVIYGDSVTGDRPVVVRNPSGVVTITPIAELFDNRNKVGMRRKEATELDGWEALSIDRNGNSQWKPINRVIRHKTDKEVVELRHRNGQSVTTTDHSYIIGYGPNLLSDSPEFITAKPEEVREPLRIVNIPEVDTIDAVDLPNGWKLGVGTKELDALLRIIGAYIAEGSISGKHFRISESRKDWLDNISNDIMTVFGFETTFQDSPGAERELTYENQSGSNTIVYEDKTKSINLYNKEVTDLFGELCGIGSAGKKIPKFVYHLPQDKQDIVINKMVEGDGAPISQGHTKEYSDRNFGYGSKSKTLMAGLSFLLRQRGIYHSFRFRDDKDFIALRTVDTHGPGRNPDNAKTVPVEHDGYVYDLDVQDNDNFVDGIGCIVLHNTDSIMISMGDDVDKEVAVQKAKKLANFINESYDEYAEQKGLDLTKLGDIDKKHFFELEMEKLYKRFFQQNAQKKYAGHIVWKEGKWVDDFDFAQYGKKSDMSQLSRDLQEKFLKKVLTGADKKELQEYVTDICNGIKNGEYSIHYIGIPSKMKKRFDEYKTDRPVLRGSKYANKHLQEQFGKGDKPKYIYVKSTPRGLPSTDVVCFSQVELPDGFRIDTDKMIRKCVRDKIKRMLAVLDYDWNEMYRTSSSLLEL